MHHVVIINVCTHLKIRFYYSNHTALQISKHSKDFILQMKTHTHKEREKSMRATSPTCFYILTKAVDL